MKIAEITYSMTSGGAETFVRQLSCEFKRKGYDVTVVLLDRVGTSEYEKNAQKILKEAGVKVKQIDRTKNLCSYFISFFVLLKYLKQERFDILHSNGGLLDTMSSLCNLLMKVKTKLVFTIHNSQYNTKGIIAKFIKYCQNRGQVVFCSKAAMEANISQAYKKVTFIENGVAVFSENSFKTNLQNINVDSIKLLTVGRIHTQKNRECMIHAVKWLHDNWNRNIILWICGGGNSSALESLALDLGISDEVKFLGVRSDVAELLAKADIFVSTSLFEGLPIAVLEAFNSGISCVLSPIKEHSDIGNKVEGCYLAQSNTPDAIAKSIIEAYDNLQPKEIVRAKRKDVMDKYSISTCADNYLKLFTNLMGIG